MRPVLEATAFKLFDFKLMPDFAGGTTVLQDAYADLKFVPCEGARRQVQGPVRS